MVCYRGQLFVCCFVWCSVYLIIVCVVVWVPVGCLFDNLWYCLLFVYIVALYCLDLLLRCDVDDWFGFLLGF